MSGTSLPKRTSDGNLSHYIRAECEIQEKSRINDAFAGINLVFRSSLWYTVSVRVILIRFLEREVEGMAISYKKLWKLLIDKDMKKKDLQRVAGISSASITKLGKNENVNTEIIEKICVALQCDVSDIMEMVDD